VCLLMIDLIILLSVVVLTVEAAGYRVLNDVISSVSMTLQEALSSSQLVRSLAEVQTKSMQSAQDLSVVKSTNQVSYNASR